MLVECGFVRAQASDGQEFTFRPSLARIATLGSPREIVSLYAGLHGPSAAQDAAYVLACLCDQDDAAPLIGHHEPGSDDKAAPVWKPGAMPAAEQILVARHLMEHGICGKARPGAAAPAEQGGYSEGFDAVEYIAAARVHLGLSSADAEALSMTELQRLLEMKFPSAGTSNDVPNREEYDAQMAAIKAIQEARGG